MIYFDNSATTKMAPEALETYSQVVTKIWGNPSSLHKLGDRAHGLLEASPVLGDLTKGNVTDSIGDLLQEVVVVGNDHCCPIEVVEVISQPLNVRSIQVVRRFVQQDDVWILQEHLGQDDF